MSIEGTTFKWLSKNLAKIPQFLKKIIVRIKYGKVRIIVFGAGGVGKTTFKDYVIEGKRALLEPVKHDESYDVEYFDFGNDDFWGELIITPGQSKRRELHWPTLVNEIVKGDINGIVYICSYGCHSMRGIDHKRHDLYKDGDTNAQFLKKYQQSCLETELQAFQKFIVPMLLGMDSPPWVLFLISKQDLWWSERDKVRDYYQQGGVFDLALRKLQEQQEHKQLKIEFCNVCFRAENLETRNGTVMMPISKGYTDQERIGNLDKVLKVMNDMIRAKIRIKW